MTVNVGWEGWLHLFHVPDQGIGDRELQRTDVPFPQGRWVRITTWLDFSPDHGSAAVWQDGVLVSAARVRGGDGSLDQMHFGLYAPPSLTHGMVANDDIAVYRVTHADRNELARAPAPLRPATPAAASVEAESVRRELHVAEMLEQLFEHMDDEGGIGAVALRQELPAAVVLPLTGLELLDVGDGGRLGLCRRADVARRWSPVGRTRHRGPAGSGVRAPRDRARTR